MFEKFTHRSLKVVHLAKNEAKKLKQDYTGTEHLLLGLILENTGVAGNVLDRLGIAAQAVRNEIIKITQSGAGHIENPPLTSKLISVFEIAGKEASNLDHNYIGTEHLLLGVLSENTLALQIIVNLGYKPQVIREEVLGLIGESKIDKIKRMIDYALDTPAYDYVKLLKEIRDLL